MQPILLSAILAVVAGIAVDSAEIQRSKAVGKRELWQYGASEDHGQDRSSEWNKGGNDNSHEQIRMPVHPVHEWHEEEGHEHSSSIQRDFHQWKPSFGVTGSASSYKGNSNKKEIEEHHIELNDHGDKEQHHHHHHHVKVVEVPKPFPIHVDKPYPVFVEKPVIVEKHVPLKFYIKKTYHH